MSIAMVILKYVQYLYNPLVLASLLEVALSGATGSCNLVGKKTLRNLCLGTAIYGHMCWLYIYRSRFTLHSS